MNKRKFAISLLTSLVFSTGFASQQYAFASGQFVQGDQYEQGAYDLNAQSPTTYSWIRHSRYNGVDRDPQVKWKFTPAEGIIKVFYSTPVVAADGTIYAVSQNGYLYVLNPDGTLKWSYKLGLNSSPVIAQDGTIYVGSTNGIVAFNPDSTVKWTSSVPAYRALVIGKDGTIYSCGNEYLYAINPDGSLKWRTTVKIKGNGVPAVAADGTIYIATNIGGGGTHPVALHAFNPDGTSKWSYWFEPGKGYSGWGSPAIGPDGTIYIGSDDYNLHAINPDGSLKWKFPTGNLVMAAPVVGDDGTIYFGSVDTKFYAVNPDGTKKWEYNAGNSITTAAIIDSNGDIIFGTSSVGKYICLNADGTLKWSLSTFDTLSAPTIMKDGTILFGNRYDITAISGPVDSADPCETIHQLEKKINAGLETQSEIDEANNLLQSLRARLDQYQNQIDAAQQ